jgi:pimeloyl-ACP methyl ester carboxylesterase
VSRHRTLLGVAGAAGGAVAAGVAAGLFATHQSVQRQLRAPDPYRDEPFGRLPADRTRVVWTADGVGLNVVEVGPADAPLTVVLVHGYTLSLDCWHFQRQALAARPGVRVVLYDQRSHGRSGRSQAGRCTIDQLGEDLAAVLAAVAPQGPVVLVGHSMGGMTIMSLADRHPELFGTRVVGVALVSTSAGRVSELTFGLPAGVIVAARRLLPAVTVGARGSARLVELGRRRPGDITYAVTRRFSFGSEASPSLVAFMERMVAGTPLDVLLAFLPTFLDHDKLAALDVLRGIPVLIVGGENDLMTPVVHSEQLAAALPDADFVRVPQAGHMAILERSDVVNRALERLLDRVAVAGGARV